MYRKNSQLNLLPDELLIIIYENFKITTEKFFHYQ